CAGFERIAVGARTGRTGGVGDRLVAGGAFRAGRAIWRAAGGDARREPRFASGCAVGRAAAPRSLLTGWAVGAGRRTARERTRTFPHRTLGGASRAARREAGFDRLRARLGSARPGRRLGAGTLAVGLAAACLHRLR